jgi:hypothetical protein
MRCLCFSYYAECSRDIKIFGTQFANMMMDNFQGKDSSDDEDLHDFPDDDQYDTEDSFIDDAELVSVIAILHIHVDLYGV